MSTTTIIRPVWLFAALGALALHAGGLAMVVSGADPSDDLASGAPAIEIGLEPAAPRLDQTALPPGPESDSATAAQAMQEQKAVVEEADVPKATPTETDEPDRLVTETDVVKPTEKEPDRAAVKAELSAASVASEATAPPSAETLPEAPRLVAPQQGAGETARLARLTWQKRLMVHLDRHKRYPVAPGARTAEVTVSFTLDRAGHVLAASIAKGSGEAVFDGAALAMMKRADPVPAPPPAIADEGLSFTLPVVFRDKKRG